VKHQAPFGIACFRAPACGDGANGSGALHALLLPIVRRLCVISYRPPLRVRLALGECYAERRPPDLPGFVRRRRPRTVFARGPAIGEVLRDLRSESDVRAATCSPRPLVQNMETSARRVPVPRRARAARRGASFSPGPAGRTGSAQAPGSIWVKCIQAIQSAKTAA
jgi:hypothetical protein